MKKIVALVPVLLMLFGLTTAYAADTMKVGVVDLPKIMQESSQYKALNDQLKNEFSSQQKQIIDAQNKLRSEADKLAPNASTKLNDSQRKEVKDQLIAGQKRLQKMVVKFQEHVSEAQNKAMKQFTTDINDAVEKVAKEKDLSIVLLKPAVLYAHDSVDITPEVLAALPKK